MASIGIVEARGGRLTHQLTAVPVGADMQDDGKVAILLGTFNGEAYLAEQLASIAAQEHTSWAVWASDDGSHDGTQAILDAFGRQWGDARLSVVAGPRKGFAANFLSLACRPEIDAEYFAFSDQDDIWAPGKLRRALVWLKSIPRDTPALYCTRTQLVDADNHDLGLSPLFSVAPGFRHALVQNIGSGNTMVFNAAARRLLAEAGAAVNVAAHDWWTYLVVSGCGGRVFYDPQPSVRYRQHAGNAIGVKNGLRHRLARLRRILGGRYKAWNDANLDGLTPLRGSLTRENRNVFDKFSQSRRKWLVPRVTGVIGARVVRQDAAGRIGLLAGSILKRI